MRHVQVFVCVALFCTFVTAATAPRFVVENCVAQTPEVFICEFEYPAKWAQVDVEWDNLQSGGNCNPCSVTSRIKLDPNSNTPTARIEENLGEPYSPTGTGDSAPACPNGGSMAFSEEIEVDCDDCVTHDASYSAGDCPVQPPEVPDGPGPCSIASVTFCCSICE